MSTTTMKSTTPCVLPILARRDITKQIITTLQCAPVPEPCTILQIREGRVGVLGNSTFGTQPSAIYKKIIHGRQYVGPEGLGGDEHVYYNHGGIDRALHQYPSSHYPDWRIEAPYPELFQAGGFGENFVGTNMTEDNVCIGDHYRIGEDVVVEISEPRGPCSKLNVRFNWPRALKRVQRTGRVGWYMRVIQPGWVEEGDSMVLVERPYPYWSVINVKRVIQGKTVSLPLLSELAGLGATTDMVRSLASKRLETTSKQYRVIDIKDITSRVKQLTVQLDEPVIVSHPEFKRFSFAQIEFGLEPRFARSYSIVSGNMNRFCLGVALDDHSRGGSAYIHHNLKVGDRIHMAPGSSPKAIDDEDRCIREGGIDIRIVIIGGIGVTAFLPIIKEWDASNTPYEIHYAVRDADDVAFVEDLPKGKTTIYAKSRKQRLDINELIPGPAEGKYHARIYSCGPSSMMEACKARCEKLGYPEHQLHFESFGTAAGGPRGDEFDVEVNDADSGKSQTLNVPADKTLLTVLREAGFDMTFFCRAGGCGACRATLCGGKAKHNGTALLKNEEETTVLTCVDRGIGPIKIELD